jgi:uncharacterized protein (UPF0297 family)
MEITKFNTLDMETILGVQEWTLLQVNNLMNIFKYIINLLINLLGYILSGKGVYMPCHQSRNNVFDSVTAKYLAYHPSLR